MKKRGSPNCRPCGSAVLRETIYYSNWKWWKSTRLCQWRMLRHESSHRVLRLRCGLLSLLSYWLIFSKRGFTAFHFSVRPQPFFSCPASFPLVIRPAAHMLKSFFYFYFFFSWLRNLFPVGNVVHTDTLKAIEWIQLWQPLIKWMSSLFLAAIETTCNQIHLTFGHHLIGWGTERLDNRLYFSNSFMVIKNSVLRKSEGQPLWKLPILTTRDEHCFKWKVEWMMYDRLLSVCW